jgi:hypothetical protein
LPNSLFLNSYLDTKQDEYLTDDLRRIDTFLFPDDKPVPDVRPILATDGELFNQINNMIVKFGFVVYSSECISELNGKPNGQVGVNYYFAHFVYDTKSFLDSAATALNHRFQLGKDNREIDLEKENFRVAVKGRDVTLGKLLQKEQRWISKVKEWRDALIHRYSIPVMPQTILPPWESGNYTCRIPLEPMPVLDLMNKTKTYQEKHIDSMQDIAPFCRDWINHSKKIFDATGRSIANSISIS